jgi:hypothetical protein
MQDPDRRGRRARCAALIQGRRVHEWSWNAPSLFSKHQRAVAPRRSRVASSPEGRSVGVRHVSAPVAPLSSIFLLAFVGQLGAPAYRSSQPSAPCIADQHQDERGGPCPHRRGSRTLVGLKENQRINPTQSKLPRQRVSHRRLRCMLAQPCIRHLARSVYRCLPTGVTGSRSRPTPPGFGQIVLCRPDAWVPCLIRAHPRLDRRLDL